MGEDEQKRILGAYAKYELDYFSGELGIEVVDPKKEFVKVGDRWWLVWYFRMGEKSAAQGSMKVQLYASTMVNGVVFNLNAPMTGQGDESKAVTIVREVMESLRVVAR